MELTKLRTELPFPTRPWEAAKAKFLDGLSQEEWQRFRNATPENLFYDASAAQKRHARGSRSWVLQQKTTSLVEGIAEYGKALDVYSNASSLILCPLWGSIRVVLHIAREAGKFLERLVDMFVSVGDALPRFQIYQIIFPSQERLLRAISDAYLDVIHFCVKAKDFFSSAKGKLSMGMWKPFQQDFDIYMLQFSRHQKRVDKEARVAHMFESARRREAEAARQHEVDLANKALEQRNKKRNKRNQLLMLLRSVDYQAKHRAISRLRHPGTNVWLQSHTTYLSWLSSQGSDCQCCFGIPGSGKSILAASTVDALQPITDSTSILCYYYFDYADKKSLDPEYVLGSLIKQIVVRLDLDYFDDACNNIIEKYSSGSLDDVRHILAGFMKNSSKVYIVLDGLDELDRDGQKAILEMIDFLLTLVGPVVKLFATSRSEEGPVRLFMAKYKSLEMSSADIEDDIKIVVEQTLDSIAKHENTVLQDASIRQEISEALTLGANSM
ncbi:hypothetical protein K491DRAFT_600076 [Lophiostoma macrostomum CBS 122681]|uniref:NACHT domain-containing protein n=1 Tax=Lophiostoma macrostomum CBS 122681 TaxID=1314788 RepID=A0A6A6T7I6_9PLEO|nr:hypothetical protein K491DRAFT_600076 [Lophiostoma macrostomum CBS 122681]